VFLGDAGSIPLGFLAGALGLHGFHSGAWPAWFPLLVFSPFIVDASVTLATRLARREAVWRAHRSHLYQRLVLSGWSHRRLAGSAYVLMAAAGMSALAGRAQEPMLQCGIIAVWAVAYGIVFRVARRYLRQASDARSGPSERSVG
jgi:UDP-N-acetylmuramyl pentapeptide phosphotransferase/UDP-N-acetylglucosamine-1-phosphate transferase